MIIFYKKKKLNITAKSVRGFGKVFGLMFRTKNAQNLIFDFPKKTRMAIHSSFVFFPFLALWLDDKNRIIEKRIVRPFTLHIKPKKRYQKLLELPFNDKNKRILKILVGKETFK